MQWTFAAILAGGLWLSAAFPGDAQAAATPPSAAAFGRVPAMQSVALSPSGQLLAWIDNSGERTFVEIFDIAKGATKGRYSTDVTLKLRGLDWADDEVLLIHGSVVKAVLASDAGTYEWYRTLSMDTATGKIQILLHQGDALRFVTGSRLLSLRTREAKKVIMASWDFSAANYKQQTGSRVAGGRKDEGWTYDLFEVDTRSGEGKSLSQGTPFTNQWVVDPLGEIVARAEWHNQRQQYTVLHRRGRGWTEIFNLESGETPSLLGVTRDGSALLMRAALGRKHVAIWRLPTDGAAPQLLISDEQDDVVGLVHDPYTMEIVGGSTGGRNPEIHWLDAQAAARAKGLQKSFGGKHPDIIGRSADNTRVLVNVSTHATPGVYYLIDFKRGAADIVGEQYPALVDVPLGEVQELSYKARDGYEIPAYITLPPATTPKGLPLVVLPHGGPESHDMRDFDFIAQFLATRGYAVLQPQFRGSTGFGEEHRKAGYRQWGGLMQDDVTDGVKALIEQGVADPKRVCIVGLSYGGYSALAGAAFTPELYRCAISVNGVSDLPAMLYHERRSHGAESDTLAYWKEHIGSALSPEVAAKSPARAANSVLAPILLIHGVDDTVVPIAQSQLMSKALKAADKPHEFVELSGEDHWLSRSESRIRVLTEMEKFLGKHLPVSSPNGS